MARRMVMVDGNEAVAHVAYKLNEVIAIYPITPSSPMAEYADAWASAGKKNLWGTIPLVAELQSEGGAVAALHGALQSGSLATTFTASQGLLLMIPTIYKLAGELTPTCFHVTARSLACQALSIFGDHADVMACRQTGVALLCSNSPQEAMDMALIGTAVTLKARLPFIHFFDGFRTSHELSKIEELSDEDIRAMIDDDLVLLHRERAMTPDCPVVRGTSQNPDVYFQGRESANPFYDACPGIVQAAMDQFAKIVGRKYHLFDYEGAPDAEHVIVLMGSGAEVAHEAVEALTASGKKIGIVKVRLYRPFVNEALAAAIPASAKTVTVLDRTKEPGAAGEPLYLDVVNALAECGRKAKVLGGRYGLSSKEFTPAMVKAVFDNAASPKGKNHFTVGINDDVTGRSIDFDPHFTTEGDDVVRALFYGLGSDGTVGANHNSIAIIGQKTNNYAQGYFVYDSKKAGAITVSHLRFGPRPIRSSYLVTRANFIACHQFSFLEKYDMLDAAVEGATFLLNVPMPAAEVWGHLPRPVQQQIIDKKLKFFAINAFEVAKATGMGGRINTIMQTCFFYLSGIIEQQAAIQAIKDAIQKTYGKKGEKIVAMNFAAVDQAVAALHEIAVPAKATSTIELPPTVPGEAPEFVQNVIAPIMAGRGDSLPVSAIPVDGTWPVATTQWEKRNIALEIPTWDPDVCIQCAKCSLACPHATIRGKVYDGARLAGAPKTFKSVDAKGKEYAGMKWTIQIAPEDCTGCGACVFVCPAKNKQAPERKAINMAFQPPLREAERDNYEFFLKIPDYDRTKVNVRTIKGSQLLRPLFEYSGACAGCGETPYVKLLTQLFGDRAIMGNATGCSSIYGGNLPTTPYATDVNGRGPAWNNSLFEDAAEFSLGFRLTLDKRAEYASELIKSMKDMLGAELVEATLACPQANEAEIYQQRQHVSQIRAKLAGKTDPRSKQILSIVDDLVRKSVWALGGDGWAYDIGYGGLDHVLASGRNINVLVMDTQVYSNTGGQCSKATPVGAVAKFAAGGKPMGKKDLGLIAMTYGNIYVAQIAMGASDAQTVKAFAEAESYDGPSLIIAYSHCIAHGIDMGRANAQEKLAVDSGAWWLYRYDPRLRAEGKNPLQLDSKAPSIPLQDYIYNETRFQMLTKAAPERAAQLLALGQAEVNARRKFYEHLAAMDFSADKPQ
ncbi:MAG: pyruvate:ferredoxin (flavodoxin) oxidoreductase [Planctomycetota bacterium]|nr:pyruvate:ferredoxin (flavodoxin) oxidoreductase [Planctomycetota bacterium]